MIVDNDANGNENLALDDAKSIYDANDNDHRDYDMAK